MPVTTGELEPARISETLVARELSRPELTDPELLSVCEAALQDLICSAVTPVPMRLM